MRVRGGCAEGARAYPDEMGARVRAGVGALAHPRTRAPSSPVSGKGVRDEQAEAAPHEEREEREEVMT